MDKDEATEAIKERDKLFYCCFKRQIKTFSLFIPFNYQDYIASSSFAVSFLSSLHPQYFLFFLLSSLTSTRGDYEK
jgi:hypothetical protein